MIAADCGPGETHNAAGYAGMGAVSAADNAAGMARILRGTQKEEAK